MKIQWYTYIVCCKDRTLYTGIARDIDKRLAQHNTGTGARYTRSRRPVSLVYHEQFSSRADASRREYQIKKMDRSTKLQLISQEEK